MNVKKTFLKLTSWTVPHLQESSVLKYLPKKIKQDQFGNYFYQVGKSRTIFTSHLDTVCSGTRSKVNHVIQGNMIHTDGKTTLGADDKAGVTVMLYMIENNVPGLYYFFIGEESGCIGSSKAAKDTKRFNKSKFDRMISFDRRDTFSVITYQSSQRCCSEEFAIELSKRLSINGLNMRPDNTGVYTDSAKFIPIIPECTNISVGYWSEHSTSERQDISYLEQLCKNVCLINWETLPTVRDNTKTEYKSYGYGMYSEYDDYYENEYESRWNERNKPKTYKPKIRSINDKEFWMGHDDLNEVGDGTYGYSKYGKRIDPMTEDDHLEEGNIFLDDFLSPLELNDRTRYFDTIKDKYLDDQLTDEEIEIIKEQYLDMNNDQDINFAKELDSIKTRKNLV